MWNKFFLILFVGMLTFSLSAQQYRRYRSRRGRDRSIQTTTVQQTKTEEKAEKKTSPQQKARKSERKSSSSATDKFDPQKPVLTQNYINSVMDGQIRKKLLEAKISAKLPGHENDDDESEDEEQTKADEKKHDDEKKAKPTFISRLDFAILLSQYNSLIANFELTEVTGIRLEWYQQYQTELRKFGPIINEMTIAIRAQTRGRYAAAVQKFKDHQKACLTFLKEKPPKISKEQYTALVLKNTKIRQRNYLKRLREEREAAMKRRQEQLKQLQQKNQPKNQGTTQSGNK